MLSYSHCGHFRSRPYFTTKKFTSAPNTTASILGIKLQGYTLLELLISIAILGILYSTGLPLFRSINNTRLVSTTNELVHTLHLARSTAVKFGQRVTICQSSSGVKCDRDEEWGKGWIMFNDPNKNIQPDPDEQIIIVHPALQFGYSILWRPSGFRKDYVSFLPGGSTNKSGTFSICSKESSNLARTVVVYRTGRIRTGKRKPDGNPADCP